MKSSSILITSWPESNAPVLFVVVPMNNIGGDSILNFNEAGEIDKEFDELLGEPCRPGMLKENLLLLWSGILTLLSSIDTSEDPEDDGVRSECGRYAEGGVSNVLF